MKWYTENFIYSISMNYLVFLVTPVKLVEKTHLSHVQSFLNAMLKWTQGKRIYRIFRPVTSSYWRWNTTITMRSRVPHRLHEESWVDATRRLVNLACHATGISWFHETKSTELIKLAISRCRIFHFKNHPSHIGKRDLVSIDKRNKRYEKWRCYLYVCAVSARISVL